VSSEATLRALADLEAIRDLARRYAHCVWQQDAAGASALFADDAEMDTGEGPPLRGREAVREAYEAMFETTVLRPMVHNHVIDLDGDRAGGTCYLDLSAVMDGADRVGSGYYLDRYVRVGENWRFQSRKLTMCYFVESTTKFTAS
jgi:ketosteroid isomerase-like protein